MQQMLADIVLSAQASLDIAVEMKQRILREYSLKAVYFDDNPDYALYAMTIGEQRSVVKMLRNGKSDVAALADAEQRLLDLEAQFARVSHCGGHKRLTFDKMHSAYAEKDDYVWNYAYRARYCTVTPKECAWCSCARTDVRRFNQRSHRLSSTLSS